MTSALRGIVARRLKLTDLGLALKLIVAGPGARMDLEQALGVIVGEERDGRLGGGIESDCCQERSIPDLASALRANVFKC
jgi:hypothetical protein